MEPLTEREREILAFARLHWQYAGSREAAIRERFDVTTTRYAQELNKILNLPAAEAHDPFTVRRLRRLRQRGQRSRSLSNLRD